MESRTNLQTDDDVKVDFGVEIAGAVPLLQALDVQFDSDHSVLSIGGGCLTWVAARTGLILRGARAVMNDSSGNYQDNSASSVDILVVAVPA